MDEKSGGCLGKIIGSNCNNTITSFTEPWSHPSIVHHSLHTNPVRRQKPFSLIQSFHGEKRQWHHAWPVAGGHTLSQLCSHIYMRRLTRLVMASHRNLVPLGRLFTGTLVNILTLDSCNTLMVPALWRIPWHGIIDLLCGSPINLVSGLGQRLEPPIH